MYPWDGGRVSFIVTTILARGEGERGEGEGASH